MISTDKKGDVHAVGKIEDYLEIGCVHGALFPETLKGEGRILEAASSILHDDYLNRIEIGHIKDEVTRYQFKNYF